MTSSVIPPRRCVPIFYRDVAVLNVSKDEWRRFVSPTCPGPRSAHAVAASPAGGGKLYLFGACIHFACSLTSSITPLCMEVVNFHRCIRTRSTITGISGASTSQRIHGTGSRLRCDLQPVQDTGKKMTYHLPHEAHS